MAIDLNCDLGEGEPPDHTAALMRWINSANIACGAHAGDEASMRLCVQLAKKHGVNVGAHPGPHDRATRGRADAAFTGDDLVALIQPQIEALKAIADEHGKPLHHVKLHGVLYHATECEASLASAYVELVKAHWPGTTLVALAGGNVVRVAKQAGMAVWEEAFADRAYQLNGRLVPRREPFAVLHDPGEIVNRVTRLISEQTLPTICGNTLPLRCDTLCVHSDSGDSVEIVRQLSALLRPGTST